MLLTIQFIGHIGELHYISNVPVLYKKSSSEIVNCKSIVNDGKRECSDVREKESNQLSVDRDENLNQHGHLQCIKPVTTQFAVGRSRTV